jgi:cation diffusion facilitator CzcD-associated flavoprotein CzcO
MEEVSVLIIGAGPAGLAVAARLRRRGIPFHIIEAGRQVGMAWHEHYDRLHLHTVKEKSHLPYLPFPKDYPRYVSRERLCAYFQTYAETFDIRPHFGEKAASIRRAPDGRWRVYAHSGREWLAGRVVLATGVNRVPYQPVFPGQERFEGRIIHSKAYKNPAPYAAQRVLVVGMGNTGAEIALDLADNGVTTFISVRGPVNIVPRDFLGRPTQLTALALAKLPNWLGDGIGKAVRRLTMGDLREYGLSMPDMAPARQLREMGKTPVVDIGAANAVRAGRIRVLPAIERFESRHIVFQDGQNLPFDAVVLATGYRPQLEDLLENTDELLDQYGCPRQVVGAGPYRGLFFIGFDNYTPGGILGVINRDSAIIAEEIGQSQTSDQQ